jgi:hypothetical protein
LQYDKIRKLIQCLDDEQQKVLKSDGRISQFEAVSIYDFLLCLDISWQDYVLSLRSSVQKPTVSYKREVSAIKRNMFNSQILKMQRSNMDAQYVLDSYSAATYISSHMMKTDLALSKLMKDACSSVCSSEGNAGQIMRAMGNALLNGQEMSVQHAVYVCIGLLFRGSSRKNVFVPSSPPSQRTFLVKQDWELKSLPPESTDCMALSLVDKYALQKTNPHLRELGADSTCLADFAALFSPDQ